MRESDPFPKPTDLKDKGYQQFPESLTSAELSGKLAKLNDHCSNGLFALSELERFKRENPDPPYVIGLGLSSFQSIIDTLNNDAKHPADLSHIISDADFFKNFRSLVEGIRKSGILAIADDFLKSANVRQDQENVSRIRRLVDAVKVGLVQADIYLASRIEKNG